MPVDLVMCLFVSGGEWNSELNETEFISSEKEILLKEKWMVIVRHSVECWAQHIVHVQQFGHAHVFTIWNLFAECYQVFSFSFKRNSRKITRPILLKRCSHNRLKLNLCQIIRCRKMVVYEFLLFFYFFFFVLLFPSFSTISQFLWNFRRKRVNLMMKNYANIYALLIILLFVNL